MNSMVMSENPFTAFKIIAESKGQTYVMEFAVPRFISEPDWQEIARMMKANMVTLSKLPIDNALDPITIAE